MSFKKINFLLINIFIINSILKLSLNLKFILSNLFLNFTVFIIDILKAHDAEVHVNILAKLYSFFLEYTMMLIDL